MKPANSLRRSLLLNLAWLLIPTVLIGTAIAYFFATRGVMHTYDLVLLDDATDIAEQVQIERAELSLNIAPAVFKLLARNNEDDLNYAAWMENSLVVAGDETLRALAQPLMDKAYRFDSVSINGQPRRMVLLRRVHEGNTFLIAVAATTHEVSAIQHSVLIGMVLLGLLLVTAALLGAVVGVRRGLRPLYRLREEISERSSLDLNPLQEAMAPAELRPVVHGVNELMKKLGAAIDSHRSFIADAAHQLRTPLAVLQSQVELALRQHAEPVESDQSAFLKKLLVTTRGLSHLTNQLLSLARLDHASRRAIHDLCDLDAVVRSAAASYVAAGARREIEFRFSLQPCTLKGDPFLLQEMFKNLFDNAICYTQQGGTVELLMRIDKDMVDIRMLDDGSGVAPSALSRLGTRFFREHPTASEGCGLGLAIVREVVDAHGGRVTFSNRVEGHGLVVEIQLPLV